MSWEEDQRKIKNSLEKQYREEGARLAKLEAAKKMRKENINISTIVKITDLTQEEIENL